VPGASKTESPCLDRAAVKIRGVAFCGACAREQEAYFAIGELVRRRKCRVFRSKPLTEALKRMRGRRAAGRDSSAVEVQHALSGAY
jgi:hypothetical protein